MTIYVAHMKIGFELRGTDVDQRPPLVLVDGTGSTCNWLIGAVHGLKGERLKQPRGSYSWNSRFA